MHMHTHIHMNTLRLALTHAHGHADTSSYKIFEMHWGLHSKDLKETKENNFL